MKSLLEKYWEKGYWCAFDRGDRPGTFPDILYTKPLITYPKGKEGRVVARMSTDEWDEESRTPVEAEVTPSKNPEQVRQNFEKNVSRYGKVRFVVASRNQMPEIIRILADKDRTKYQVVHEDIGIPEDELGKLVAEDDTPQTE
jgi:hypothetical protein